MQQQDQVKKEKMMLFISRIPPQSKRKDLRECFKKYGVIYIHRFVNKHRSRAPKIAEIEIKCEKMFKDILKEEEHFLPCGAAIKVEKLLRGDNLEKKMKGDLERKVSIMGIKGEIDDKELKIIFEHQFGPIDFCYYKRYKGKKKVKGYGFVSFVNKEDADRAIKQGRIKINGSESKIKSFILSQGKKGSPPSSNSPVSRSISGAQEDPQVVQEKEQERPTVSVNPKPSSPNQDVGVKVSTAAEMNSKERTLKLSTTVQKSEAKNSPKNTKSLKKLDSRRPPKFLSLDYSKFIKNKFAFYGIKRLKIPHNDFLPTYDDGKKVNQCISRVSAYVNLNHYKDNLEFSS